MTHKIAVVQDWKDRVCATHEDSADLMHRCQVIQKGLKGHYPVILPIFADLHILADIKMSKIINDFFRDDKKTKGEALAEMNTWKGVQKFIESLIPTHLHKEFNDVRRSRVFNANI